MIGLQYDQGRIEEICRKYQVSFLGVFGSVARGDQRADSDVDLLVRYKPDENGGLFELVNMRDDLQEIFSRKIDLLTEGFLSRHFRDEVISEIKPIYGHPS